MRTLGRALLTISSPFLFPTGRLMILVWEKVVVLPALKLLVRVCGRGPGKP